MEFAKKAVPFNSVTSKLSSYATVASFRILVPCFILDIAFQLICWSFRKPSKIWHRSCLENECNLFQFSQELSDPLYMISVATPEFSIDSYWNWAGFTYLLSQWREFVHQGQCAPALQYDTVSVTLNPQTIATLFCLFVCVHIFLACYVFPPSPPQASKRHTLIYLSQAFFSLLVLNFQRMWNHKYGATAWIWTFCFLFFFSPDLFFLQSNNQWSVPTELITP